MSPHGVCYEGGAINICDSDLGITIFLNLNNNNKVHSTGDNYKQFNNINHPSIMIVTVNQNI